MVGLGVNISTKHFMKNDTAKVPTDGQDRLLISFGLFTSFDRWRRAGFLSRQIELYNEYSQNFDRVFVKSYENNKFEGSSHNIEHITFSNIFLSKYFYFLFGGLHKYRNVEYVEVEDVTAFLVSLPYKIAGSRIFLYHKYDLVEAVSVLKNPVVSLIAYILQIMTFKIADCVAVTTKTLGKRVSKHTKTGVYLLPNHVDTMKFSPDSGIIKIPNLLIFVGRLHQQKNLQVLLKAMSHLPQYTLWIIGEGPLQNQLMHMKQEYKLDNVDFLGLISNEQLSRYLNQSQAFVLVSVSEGHPKALLEAMACGLPTIGSNVTGVNDVITNEETGVLCEPTSEGIEKAVITLFSNKQKMEQMGRKSREFAVNNFSKEKIIERRIKLIKGELDGIEPLYGGKRLIVR